MQNHKGDIDKTNMYATNLHNRTVMLWFTKRYLFAQALKNTRDVKLAHGNQFSSILVKNSSVVDPVKTKPLLAFFHGAPFDRLRECLRPL